MRKAAPGVAMKKHGAKGKPKSRTIKVDPDLKVITYKSGSSGSIPFSNISDVQKGRNDTPSFNTKHGLKATETHLISIECDPIFGRESLCLEAGTMDQRNEWYNFVAHHIL